MPSLNNQDYYDLYQNELESSEQASYCHNLADDLLNDVNGTDTRTRFIQNLLKWVFNEDTLRHVLNQESNDRTKEDLTTLFDIAQELDPEELKAIYDNLIGFDEYPAINERRRFTSKKILAELTDEFDEE